MPPAPPAGRCPRKPGRGQAGPRPGRSQSEPDVQAVNQHEERLRELQEDRAFSLVFHPESELHEEDRGTLDLVAETKE